MRRERPIERDRSVFTDVLVAQELEPDIRVGIPAHGPAAGKDTVRCAAERSAGLIIDRAEGVGRLQAMDRLVGCTRGRARGRRPVNGKRGYERRERGKGDSADMFSSPVRNVC